ncbi:hypothetical protein [Candidatus Methylomirabilis sp.]|uniref:Uncharacterized protein n=1 Tax=Candidatus Methylomirabilis tolerans TaxID=3123416 RepID=A0AAJ1AIZ7_9BACT|nr:hypothetical protein [Candidatus Methylomirabilis sp.]
MRGGSSLLQFTMPVLVLLMTGLWFAQPTEPQSSALAAGPDEGGSKKLIYYGWGVRDTQYVRDHWQAMEEMPFDGTGISIAIDRSKPTTGNGATENLVSWQVMGRRSFRVEEFRRAISDLQTAKWRRFTDNFLPIALSASGSAAGLNWFDEERWRIIANNVGVLARIAAEARLKGLILDPEHYNYALFSYTSQRWQIDRSFDEYGEVARRRGREVMTAIAAHLPDARIFALFGHTLPLSQLRPGKRLEDTEYSLLCAFYDGLLEAMPAGAYLIDGYEFAYPFKERHRFLEGYRRIRQDALQVSAVPEEYRKKVRAGFGLMLDYGGRPDYFTPKALQQALAYAIEISDGYVWLYSQGPQFFPPSQIDPSYIDALAAARRSN